MHLECLTCGGTYDDVTPDGYQYFHVCPPLAPHELQRAVDDGRVVLPKDETVELALSRRTYERQGKRDERAVQRTDASLPPQIVSIGRGTRPAPRRRDASGPIVVPDRHDAV